MFFQIRCASEHLNIVEKNSGIQIFWTRDFSNFPLLWNQSCSTLDLLNHYNFIPDFSNHSLFPWRFKKSGFQAVLWKNLTSNLSFLHYACILSTPQVNFLGCNQHKHIPRIKRLGWRLHQSCLDVPWTCSTRKQGQRLQPSQKSQNVSTAEDFGSSLQLITCGICHLLHNLPSLDGISARQLHPHPRPTILLGFPDSWPAGPYREKMSFA